MRAVVWTALIATVLALSSPNAFAEAPARAMPGVVDAAQLQQISKTFVRIAERITPAVVGISTSRTLHPSSEHDESGYFRWFFDTPSHHPEGQQQEEGVGSGVLVSADGLIVTNAHVIEGAERIRITLSDRRAFDAVVVGVDAKTDVAVLRAEATGLPWVPFGDSASLRPGELVLAVGNPFGLVQTVTMGIVSAVGRQGVGIADYEDFIQTDAAINPGNSGGAMVNTRGELIGINTAIFTQSGGYEGIGFAIPAGMAKMVTRNLIERGKVVRGWLGVSIQEVTPPLVEPFGLDAPKGALVTDVMADSPAEKAGLQRGDIVLQVDGHAITRLSELRLMVANLPVGTHVDLKVHRERKPLHLQVKLGELPHEEAPVQVTATATEIAPTRGKNKRLLSGLKVGDIDGEAVRRYRLQAPADGVVVHQVAAGSAASLAGILPGDIVLEVARTPVTRKSEFDRVLRQADRDSALLLLLSRRGRAMYVGVSP